MNIVALLNCGYVAIVKIESIGGINNYSSIYDNEDFWLTQKSMAELFNLKSNIISYRLNEVYESKELIKNSTNWKDQKEGN